MTTPRDATMIELRVTRRAQIPDLLRIRRCQQSPELGPQVLFFTGGTALDGLSRILPDYTHRSSHLVTPFDSGGSSAKLRAAFDMPAVGDIRSRLMALADDSMLGHPDVCRLFQYRLPVAASPEALAGRLAALAAGEDPLMRAIIDPMHRLIRQQLGHFCAAKPDDFDLRGASVGNLILAGGYLSHHHQLDPIIFLFSKLVQVRGTVRAIVDEDYHLAVTLGDGTTLIGQHRLTGKEVAPLTSAIANIGLSRRTDAWEPVIVPLPDKSRRLIDSAELICFPPGSFYSSLIANLLPAGVGRAIRDNPCPKVFIPNTGVDPEQVGMSLDQQLDTLLAQLRLDAGESTPAEELLSVVLLDSRRGDYSLPMTTDEWARGCASHGITVVDTRLISETSAPYYDDDLLARALISLA